MASRAAPSRTNDADWRGVMLQSVQRSLELIAALVLTISVVFLALALMSYSQTDPSGSTAAAGAVDNWMGASGAWASERILFLFGPVGVLVLPFLFFTARRLWRNEEQPRWWRRVLVMLLGMALLAMALALAMPVSSSNLPAQWGGVSGLAGSMGITALAGRFPDTTQMWILLGTGLIAAVGGTVLCWRALALGKPAIRRPNNPLAGVKLPWQGKAKAITDAREPAEERFVPGVHPGSIRAETPDEPINLPDRPRPTISEPMGNTRKAEIGQFSKQGDFFGDYDLPSLDLLTPAETGERAPIDKLALERNARLLETVLEDFHVKGQITAVRPGPVVTMYELEPAPGVKANRVVGLAEDIARNMSAISARVSSVPGRTVMGIELPNAHREMVSLHEMIGSNDFAGHKGDLPIILGKDIAGEPVIADLAAMPHLLVAGTTGSGKSVGLNCVILSLLYRLTPDQCRLILIDPKVLEMASYDNIPHLLSPVVTEPGKAIRALKWAVEQMEERYRKMSSIGVRNLANFNEKVNAAKAKGKPLGRRVLTGYDQDSGEPIFEEEVLEFAPLPLIVVVVDELADLMVTAGKEIEVLIQRLSQKSRAAGIHLIMATQRPSVDVITGVIKANLPTRISFHVTSKIDSRTILGEQGAEQLLGKGDMLYMANGKSVKRVHGPFVSDDDVIKVADHWRGQGAPDYISSVTEEVEGGDFGFDDEEGGSSDPQYAQACQLVFESQKASASWLQRQMRIGYNTASRLIERMEADGFVGPPNHVGRRDIYRDKNGDPL